MFDVTGGLEHADALVPQLLAAAGAMAFFVSAIVQTVKSLPGLKRLQTNVVAFAVSIIVSLFVAFSFTGGKADTAFSYCLGNALLMSFPVYLMATGGYEKVHRILVRIGKKDGDGDNGTSDQSS